MAEQRLTDAGRLFGIGEAALSALGTPVWPANRPDYERWLERARTSRAIADFDRARAGSRTLTPDQVITSAHAGNPFQAAISPGNVVHARLTPREKAVARLAAGGLSNRDIAAALAITAKTAANHLQHVLEKLDLRSRAQLAARATELGINRNPTPDDVP